VGGTATLIATSVETPTRILVFTDNGRGPGAARPT
jgi:hypothetical protein